MLCIDDIGGRRVLESTEEWRCKRETVYYQLRPLWHKRVGCLFHTSVRILVWWVGLSQQSQLSFPIDLSVVLIEAELFIISILVALSNYELTGLKILWSVYNIQWLYRSICVMLSLCREISTTCSCVNFKANIHNLFVFFPSLAKSRNSNNASYM